MLFLERACKVVYIESKRGKTMTATYETYKALPKKLTASHVGSSFKAKLEDIKLVFNVRGIKNVSDVHNDLIPSIKAVGIQQELTINLKGELIDGHRRLSAAKELELDSVPVIIKDVSREEISLYQVANANRKNLSASEIAFAIQDYYAQNPKVPLTEIEEKFKVSRQAVWEALKLQRISPALSSLVNDGLLSKGAAERIISSNISGKPQEVTDLEKRKIQEVVDIIIPNIERDKEAKEAENQAFKPWSLRDVNKLFPGESRFSSNKENNNDDDQKKTTSGKLLKAVVSGLLLSPQELQDGSLLVELTLSKEIYEALVALQSSQAKISYLKADFNPEDNAQISAILRDLSGEKLTAIAVGNTYLVSAEILEIHPEIAVTDLNGELKRTTLAELKKLVRNGTSVQIIQQENKVSKATVKNQKETPAPRSKEDENILNAIDQLEELDEVNFIPEDSYDELAYAVAEEKAYKQAQQAASVVNNDNDDDDDDMFTAGDSFGFEDSDDDDDDYNDEDEI